MFLYVCVCALQICATVRVCCLWLDAAACGLRLWLVALWIVAFGLRLEACGVCPSLVAVACSCGLWHAACCLCSSIMLVAYGLWPWLGAWGFWLVAVAATGLPCDLWLVVSKVSKCSKFSLVSKHPTRSLGSRSW